MPLPQDLVKNDLVKGVAIGIGLALLVPVAVAALAPVLKPAVRAALKAGLVAMEKGREMLAELGETVQDVAAETQAELRESRFAAATEVLEDAEETAANGADAGSPTVT
jgi:hypothetical protein